MVNADLDKANAAKGAFDETKYAGDLAERIPAQYASSGLLDFQVKCVRLSQTQFRTVFDHDDSLVGGRIWTEREHMQQRLTDLTEHMETVIQKYLRNEYESIAAYNADAEVPEPYRFVVVAGKRCEQLQRGAYPKVEVVVPDSMADARSISATWTPTTLNRSPQHFRITPGYSISMHRRACPIC